MHFITRRGMDGSLRRSMHIHQGSPLKCGRTSSSSVSPRFNLPKCVSVTALVRFGDSLFTFVIPRNTREKGSSPVSHSSHPIAKRNTAPSFEGADEIIHFSKRKSVGTVPIGDILKRIRTRRQLFRHINLSCSHR